MNCKCETVKKYDGEHRCMTCYRRFYPEPSKLESKIRQDYQVDTWDPAKPYPDEPGFIHGAGTG